MSSLFSDQAENYAKFRPVYPRALLVFLNDLPKQHDLLWDCGTGNGQVANDMAAYFKKVVATDISEKQIQHAKLKNNVTYRVAPAEHSGLAHASVDLITIAQAVHWFDFVKFHAEVKRVLKPDGVIAMWCYQLFSSDNDALNQLINEFHYRILAPFWATQRQHVDEGYAHIPFPYSKERKKHFSISHHMRLADLLSYLKTWSAVNTCFKQTGENPVDCWMREKLAALSEFHELKSLKITWPVVMLVGELA